ncbi:hypothetical protein FHW67_000884 [Herbaspirillum sp. Sphag1AN]|nr:hypothetical protein [Herbaspirillum sp. Sphag1AN]MBB3245096.1 hypothetical protein [Herbaspirillum sp. Sphag64]
MSNERHQRGNGVTSTVVTSTVQAPSFVNYLLIPKLVELRDMFLGHITQHRRCC